MVVSLSRFLTQTILVGGQTPISAGTSFLTIRDSWEINNIIQYNIQWTTYKQ